MNMENTYLFEQYLMAGRGKAYLMATDDPLKYAEVVLEACKRNIAFDIQSEGSRAFLIADIVDLYNDRTPFVQATIDEYVEMFGVGERKLNEMRKSGRSLMDKVKGLFKRWKICSELA